MRKYGATIYATICSLALAAGFLLAFGSAWKQGISEAIVCIVCLLAGGIVAPILHETGHIVFARCANMRIVYVKCFCFQWRLFDGKLRFALAKPFAPDETQVIPKSGGNMQKRVRAYTLGGLVFGFVFLIVCAVVAVLFRLYGLLPYPAYLLLLNVAPFEYPVGKTDMLVYVGLKKNYSAEQNMLVAMEIQGRVYAGESYAEIEESAYASPQLAEDEPLFAVMTDLRYRYYVEKGDIEKAAEQLNRLAMAQEYLPETEAERIAAELVYVHSLLGDFERAVACGKLCETYLQADNASAKRILAAYSCAFGKEEAVEPLKALAEKALEKEWIEGNKKFERVLLSRISAV